MEWTGATAASFSPGLVAQRCFFDLKLRMLSSNICTGKQGCGSGPFFWPDPDTANQNVKKPDPAPVCTYPESIKACEIFHINLISSDIFMLIFFS